MYLYLLMCISNPIPVTVSLGKCSNLITVSVKDNFTLANTVNKGEKNVCQYIEKKRIAFTVTISFIHSCTKIAETFAKGFMQENR